MLSPNDSTFKRIAQCLYALALGACTHNTYACDKGYAVISGNALYPPLTWERQGTLTGVSVEVITSILSEVNIKTSIGHPAPWKRLVHRAEHGEIDILLGVRKNHEWEHFLHYLEPPLTPSVQGIFHLRTTDLKYQNWGDLTNKPGGILRGTSFGEQFDIYAKDHLNLQETNALEQNFLKLEKGRIQYLLAPLVPTQLYLQQAGFEKKITNTKHPLLAIDEYIAMSKHSSCIQYIEHISKRLQEMINNEDIDSIMEKYFLTWFNDREATETKK